MRTYAVISVVIILLCHIAPCFPKDIPDIFLGLDTDFTSPGGIVEGANVELMCSVDPWNDTLPIKRTDFFHDDKPLLSNQDEGIVVWGHSLSFENIEKKSNGKYQCHVYIANLGTLKSNFFHITVDDKPNITYPDDIKNPPDVNLYVGGKFKYTPNSILQYDKVLLICDVTPSTTKIIKRRWFHKEKELTSDASAGIKILDSTLEFESIKKASEGRYSCIVYTDVVTVYSNTVPIHVRNSLYTPLNPEDLDNPELKIKLDNKLNPDDIREFDDVYFTCELHPNTMKLNISKIYWYFNGKLILPFNRRSFLYYNSTTAVLQRVARTATGKYACKIDTDRGSLISLPLSLDIKPIMFTHIIHDPSVYSEIKPRLNAYLGRFHLPNTIKEYDHVYFTCTITPDSIKIRKLRWFHNNNELNPSKNIEILYDNTLVLPCITKSYKGNFSCLGETYDGEIRSNIVTIDVKDSTPGYTHIKNRCNIDEVIVLAELLHHPDFIYENNDVQFYCNVYPKMINVAKITWYRDGKQMKPHMNTTVTPTIPRQANKRVIYDVLSLTLRRVKKKDIADYTCKVKINGETFESDFARLANVKDKDEERKQFPDNSTQLRPIVFAELLDAWLKIYESNSVAFFCDVQPNTTYIRRVIWFLNDQKLSQIHEPNIDFNKRTLLIDNINANYAGNYSCQIEADKGTFKSKPTLLTIGKGKVHRLPWSTGRAYLFAELGDMGQLEHIHEDDNIYLICRIYPEFTTWFELTWFHNDKQLFGNETEGMEFTDQNQKLHLYYVKKRSAGTYTCYAYTKKGEVRSEPIDLKIRDRSIH